jgi:hypothetical protein
MRRLGEEKHLNAKQDEAELERLRETHQITAVHPVLDGPRWRNCCEAGSTILIYLYYAHNSAEGTSHSSSKHL